MRKGLLAIAAIFLTAVGGIFIAKSNIHIDNAVITQNQQLNDTIQAGQYKLKVDPQTSVIYSLQNDTNEKALIQYINDHSEGLSIAYDTDNLPGHYANWEKVSKSENCLKLKCKNNLGQPVITRTILIEPSGKIVLYDEINNKLINHKNVRKTITLRSLKKEGYGVFKIADSCSRVNEIPDNKSGDIESFGIENNNSAIFYSCMNRNSNLSYREFVSNNGVVAEMSCIYNCEPKDNVIIACLQKDSKTLDPFSQYGFNKIRSSGLKQIITWPFEKILNIFTKYLNNLSGVFLFIIFGLIIMTPLYILDFHQRRFLESLRLSPLLLMNKMAILKSIVVFSLINIASYMFLKLEIIGVIKNSYSASNLNFSWLSNIALADQFSLSNLLPNFFSFLNPLTGITQLICYFTVLWIFVLRNTESITKWFWMKALLVYFIVFMCNESQAFLIVFTLYLLFKEIIARHFLKKYSY